jgi:GNAT superfamily N-acetyltransferase
MNAPLVTKSPSSLPVTEYELRRATLDDVPELLALHLTALRSLSHGYYSTELIESFIEHVPTLDTQLIRHGRYFVACTQGRLIACGGWSADPPGYKSAINFGADSSVSQGDGAAMIRAMYTDPTWARRGLGRRILRLAELEALGAGHSELRLDALLPGVPLYRACHYEALNQSVGTLPDGQRLAVLHMRKVSGCGVATQADRGASGM